MTKRGKEIREKQRRGDSRIARFKRKSQHNPTVCHSERSAKHVVELSPSEERGESARRSRSGIWLKISVACRGECYIDTKATQTSCHIPSSLSLLGFACSLRSTRKTSTTKSRCDFFAQNDIQWFYLVMFVSLATKKPEDCVLG